MKFLLLVSALSIHSATYAEAQPMQVDTVTKVPAVSSTCHDLAGSVLTKYRQGTFDSLQNPIPVDLHERIETPPPGAVQLTVSLPRGMVPVVLDDRDMVGRFVSVFLDCETRKVVVSRRGGIVDATFWYGPFES